MTLIMMIMTWITMMTTLMKIPRLIPLLKTRQMRASGGPAMVAMRIMKMRIIFTIGTVTITMTTAIVTQSNGLIGLW